MEAKNVEVSLAVSVKVQTKEKVRDEIVEQCVRLQCHCCNKGIELYKQPHISDKNLYHVNGSPCRAYRIRRHYGDLRDYENKVSV